MDALQALTASGRSLMSEPETIDPLATRGAVFSKPRVVLVHGDTWNMGHEPHLVADIRTAAADTCCGQDENTHGRFPDGGATVRFVRDAGWANAMCYMLTGDHRGAEEALRMGSVQKVVLTPADAMQAGIEIAQRIAACHPLGSRATLASAHVALNSAQGEAIAKLDARYRALQATEDFKEGRRAEAEGRTPVYQGR